MYICELRVDGYGALHDEAVAFDSPVTVVFGPNEAGKSTLLRFVRSMLYGFPTRKDPVERGEPVNGGRHGGSMRIRTADGRLLLVSRYVETGRSASRAGGILTVREMDGAPLHWTQTMWEKLALGGISERLFRQLFAVTLDELHELLALQGEEIGNYLYHSGLAGGALLSDARRQLAGEMDKLYRPKGSTQEINRVLAEIKNLEAVIRQGRASLSEYQAKTQELQQVSHRLEEIGKALPMLSAEAAELRSALACREWWLKDRLLMAEERELSLRLSDQAAPVLTEEDQHAWDELLRRRGEAAARHERAKKDVIEKRAERDLLQWDEALLAHEQQLEQLEARRAACAARQEELQTVQSELQQAADLAESIAGRISADWAAEDLDRFSAIAAEREPLKRMQQEWAESLGMRRQLEAEAERLKRQRSALLTRQDSGGRERAGGGRRYSKGTDWPLTAAAGAAAVAGMLLVGALTGMLPKETAPVLAAAAVMTAVLAGVIGMRKIKLRERERALAEAGRDRLAQLEEEQAALESAMEREAKQMARVRAEWDTWLKRCRLPAALTPESVPELLSAAEQGQAAVRRLARARQRAAELRQQLELFRKEAEALYAVCTPPVSLQQDAALAVSWLFSRLKEQQAVKSEAARLDAAVRSAEAAELAAREALLAAEAEAAARIAAAGEKDEASYALRLQIDERRRGLQRERRELALRLEAGRSPDQIRQLVRMLEEHDEAALLLKLGQAEEALAGAQEEHARLLEQKGRLSQELSRLSQEAEQEDALVRLSEQESKLALLAERYAVLAVSDRLLQQTKAVFEEQRQPEVLRLASGIFSAMTGGAYTRILVPANTMQVLAETKDRRTVDSAFLSRGTQEQLYLAMRFALAEAASKETPLPLLLDDLFVHFDERRLKNTIPVLEDISGRRQVILFTCHHHVAEAICRGLPSAGMVRLAGREAARL